MQKGRAFDKALGGKVLIVRRDAIPSREGRSCLVGPVLLSSRVPPHSTLQRDDSSRFGKEHVSPQVLAYILLLSSSRTDSSSLTSLQIVLLSW